MQKFSLFPSSHEANTFTLGVPANRAQTNMDEMALVCPAYWRARHHQHQHQHQHLLLSVIHQRMWSKFDIDRYKRKLLCDGCFLFTKVGKFFENYVIELDNLWVKKVLDFAIYVWSRAFTTNYSISLLTIHWIARSLYNNGMLQQVSHAVNRPCSQSAMHYLIRHSNQPASQPVNQPVRSGRDNFLHSIALGGIRSLVW